MQIVVNKKQLQGNGPQDLEENKDEPVDLDRDAIGIYHNIELETILKFPAFKERRKEKKRILYEWNNVKSNPLERDNWMMRVEQATLKHLCDQV